MQNGRDLQEDWEMELVGNESAKTLRIKEGARCKVERMYQINEVGTP